MSRAVAVPSETDQQVTAANMDARDDAANSRGRIKINGHIGVISALEQPER